MKSVWGNCVQLSLFGESHSRAVGAVLTGLAPGIRLSPEFIAHQMDRRRAKGRISTKRHEKDQVEFLSGFFNGLTTGTPLCMVIENADQHSRDYAQLKYLPRPSHADYAAEEKYLGCQDYRGGGHFSGRLTAPIVAAGAVARQILSAKGIFIGAHIRSLHGIADTPFSPGEDALKKELSLLEERDFPALSEESAARMTAAVEQAAAEGDSLGGVVEGAVLGLLPGIGEPFFSSVESRLSELFFSIPAVKGVEFGAGFGLAEKKGSEANDPFYMEDGRVKTLTNQNGGLNGGITNGMPVVFRCAVKPTPSIYKPQQTVDLSKKENARLLIEGRHDPAVIHRAVPVVEAVTALGLLDLCAERFGYLWMRDSSGREG